jgi:hypothetical protein
VLTGNVTGARWSLRDPEFSCAQPGGRERQWRGGDDRGEGGLYIGAVVLRIGLEIVGVNAVVGHYCGGITARHFSAVEKKVTRPD